MFTPRLRDELLPAWLVNQRRRAAKYYAPSIEEDRAHAERWDAATRLTGRKIKRVFARCSRCGLPFFLGQGHIGSAYCAMMRNIIRGYAHDLFPLTRRAGAYLNMTGKFHIWLYAFPASQYSSNIRAYRDIGFLSPALWADHRAAYALYKLHGGSTEEEILDAIVNATDETPSAALSRVYLHKELQALRSEFPLVDDAEPEFVWGQPSRNAQIDMSDDHAEYA